MQNDTQLRAHAVKVDGWLSAQGIELTMGGEPTFVSADPAAAEWNTAAMGDEKLGYARRMTAYLLREVYPQALMMQVFGKWYPGEPLPRWNCMTLHVKDGQPLWPETERLMLDDVAGSNSTDAAKAFCETLARKLRVKRFLLPAAEQSAARGEIAGWVLPLTYGEGRWLSESWPYTEKRPIPLFMGDSPVGLKLPLGDLPEGTFGRALTAEVRSGVLEIFIPPLEWPAFAELIALIRKIVVELDLRDIVFCGYAPSKTNGALETMGLAADPGVLEVNLPPTSNWTEFDEVLGQSAAAADSVGLKLTKNQLNGVVYGTGGGSHLAFGGSDAEHNPFLVDPKRIASILRYWQHHPVLSYLFSGQYVGPGSQAPRVDEGPSHGLYELEVACEGLENSVIPPNGERIDQFLKNLLTDSSGNTHRAELCFDKFHNYALPNGRLGIIELRAFETFQTVEVMSAIALFVRTIFARLFKAPFGEPLKRFGSQLNDRYFLPAFLWEDLQAVCADLKANGFEFDPEWLRPALDFRCPLIGSLQTPVGEIEVRRAFESWPLMAEESQGSATVRVVDNSSDRLQVSLTDPAMLAGGKLLANGIEVPFAEVNGQMICGLRYKCASAYPALHPHVPIQSPLHLEWVNEASVTVSAVRYHYWNPQGEVYGGRPQTEAEAAERRAERWQPATDLIGYQPLQQKAKMAPEYAYTLDLRRQLS